MPHAATVSVLRVHRVLEVALRTPGDRERLHGASIVGRARRDLVRSGLRKGPVGLPVLPGEGIDGLLQLGCLAGGAEVDAHVARADLALPGPGMPAHLDPPATTIAVGGESIVEATGIDSMTTNSLRAHGQRRRNQPRRHVAVERYGRAEPALIVVALPGL